MMRCPETLGPDPGMTEALHWNANLRAPPGGARLGEIEQLAREARQNRKRLIVVFMPLPLEDIGQMDPALLAEIRACAEAVVASLASGQVELLDLIQAVPSRNFADRWCACGHLQAAGRLTVAQQIRDRLG